MNLYYIHKDTDGGDGLQLFLTEGECKAAQIELMEEARDNGGERPDYDDEEEFFNTWCDFLAIASLNQDYYFAGDVAVDGIVMANQPELKL